MENNVLRNFKARFSSQGLAIYRKHYAIGITIIGICLSTYIFSRGIVTEEYTLPLVLIGIFLFLYLSNNIKLNIYLLFIFLFSLDYLNLVLGILPRQFTWFPETLSIILLTYILLEIRFQGFPNHKAYRLFFVYLIILFIGIVINFVEPLVFLTGIRNHLKFVPFFFIPFFIKFDESEIKKLMNYLFIFTFLQCPVAVMQFFSKTTRSGDFVGGTIGANTSGLLSIFLSIMLVVWNGRFFGRRLNFFQYIVGLLALIIPMSINETKVSIILIPLAFLISAFIFPEAKRYRGKVFVVGLLFVVALFGYRFVYNYYYASSSKPRGIDTYILNPKHSLDYLAKNPKERLNRIPSVGFAYNEISRNPIHLFFGVGLGNASESLFKSASGEYHNKYGHLVITQTSYAFFLWELGLIGTIWFLIMLIYYAVFAYKGRNIVGPYNDVFIMVFAMIIIFLPMMIYTNIFRFDLFLYLFWFAVGLMINFYGQQNRCS